jgi:hypothetical protein
MRTRVQAMASQTIGTSAAQCVPKCPTASPLVRGRVISSESWQQPGSSRAAAGQQPGSSRAAAGQQQAAQQQQQAALQRSTSTFWQAGRQAGRQASHAGWLEGRSLATAHGPPTAAPPPSSRPAAAKPTFWCQSRSTDVADTAVAAASACTLASAPPIAGTTVNMCKLFIPGFVDAGTAKCAIGTIGTNGLCR